jgi:prephenate dehydrogenase
VDTLSRLDETDEVFDYAAGGFRDFTRIASSDPVMWRDICIANGDAIQLMIEHYVADLQNVSVAIQNQDSEQLLEIFSRAKAARDRYIDKQGTTD